MVKKVSLFILGNIIFVAVVVAIYGIGYEYDKAYLLYPEMKRMSYDLSMQVYGERWGRIAKFLLAFGVLSDVVILLSWYRKRQNKQKSFLDLHMNI
jgi:hypothetical protein